MAKQLLSNFGKKGDSSYTTTGVSQGLADIQVDIEDVAHLSNYFRVVEFDPVFTAGKNSISFNGSDFLADGSEIKVEVLDGDGNSLYLAAPPRDQNYVDIANFTVAIYVYQEAVSGAGSVILVGTTTKGEIIRWTGNITINTTYPNVSRVRFYHAPAIEATPLLYPVVESSTGSYLTLTDSISGSFGFQSLNPDGSSGGNNLGNILWAFQNGDPNQKVNVFNTQMVGQIMHLSYDGLETVLNNASVIGSGHPSSSPSTYQREYKHFEVNVHITDVISSNTIQTQEYVNVMYGLNYQTSHFTMSYIVNYYLNQTNTVPVTGETVSPGVMQLVASSDVFTPSMLNTRIQLRYGTLYFYGGQTIGAVDTTNKTNENPRPVLTGSFNISKVVNSRMIWVNPPTYSLFTPPYNVVATSMSGSVNFLSSSSPYQYYANTVGSSSLLQKSYVDLLYRNTGTFSGFIARHKLYAKSNIYPGDFVLISDSVVGPSELLIDDITENKAYARIGVIETQNKLDKYWFVSSASLQLIQTDDPPVLAGMIIATNGSDYSAADGTNYVIAKAVAIGLINDSVYYPFDQFEYEQFSGTGYASNFIFMPQNVLHVLSANMIVDKDPLSTVKIEFYFTSSSPNISGERDFSPTYGWKLGTITVTDKVPRRIFPDIQELFFTPLNDYYGTLVIVPYNCDVTFYNMSMQNYGDYGFSPGAIAIQLPFQINVANESYIIKSELFDSNANLVYTIPSIIQAFDPNGTSLFGSSIIGSSTNVPSTVNILTIQNELYLPGIGSCPSGKRLLGYNIPTHHPPLSGEGSLCYTDVTDLELTASNPTSPSLDYLSLSTTSGTGKSLSIRYSGTSPNVYGRRVYVDHLGNKTTYL